MGAAIKSYLNDRPGGRREGRQVWLAVPLKIKPNGEGQGERVQAKKRWKEEEKQVDDVGAGLLQGGRGSAAATSCSEAGLYKHDLSN